MFHGNMFIQVIYYVAIIEFLKNMNTKEQNSHTSNYGIMSMFINPVSARNGEAQSSAGFVFSFFLIIGSCFLITEEE